MSPLQSLQQNLIPLRQKLLSHPLYEQVGNLADLRTFMEHHVYAVWDFMSLLKALQIRLCCVTCPWIPPTNPGLARLINEIVLGEETDEDRQGGYTSHFDLYLQSMRQAGADTGKIEKMVELLRKGEPLASALMKADVSKPVQQFVLNTFEVIDSGDVCAIASAFTFGRENLLPEVFQRIVEGINQESSGQVEEFRYYLDRHIGLDGDDHGPKACQLIESLCGQEQTNWKSAENAAKNALQARLDLWDHVFQQIRKGDKIQGSESRQKLLVGE